MAKLQSSDRANPPHPRGWVMRLQFDLEPLPRPQILSRPEEEPSASSMSHMVAHMVPTHMQNSPHHRSVGALFWCHTAASHSPPCLLLLESRSGKDVTSAMPYSTQGLHRGHSEQPAAWDMMLQYRSKTCRSPQCSHQGAREGVLQACFAKATTETGR